VTVRSDETLSAACSLRVGASRAFVRAAQITYPVLRDIHGKFARAFGLKAVPSTFVIDQRGRIVAARAGQIAAHWLALRDHATPRAWWWRSHDHQTSCQHDPEGATCAV
jgi:AhpC/TSA family